MINKVFIGIGSNLSDPQAQVIKAVSRVDNCDQCQVVKSSSVYTSKPMGPQDQPDYVNAVIEIATSLSPLSLLDTLQAIESESGRVRKGERWGARILDLDVLLFNQEIINNERLTVPHYGLKEREFVLIPLLEIAEDLQLPSGESIAQLCETISHNQLAKKHLITW